MSYKLAVLTTYYNPSHSKIRTKLYREFSDRMYEVESQEIHGEQEVLYIPIELNSTDFEENVPGIGQSVHSPDQLFYKENLLKLALKNVPVDCMYVVWLDNDISFVRQDWVEATIEAMKNYDVVQLFSQVHDLTAAYEESETVLPGFGVSLVKNEMPFMLSPFGFAWAARKSFLDFVGGLCDAAPVVTAGDEFMAYALTGKVGELQKKYGLSDAYMKPWVAWQGFVQIWEPRIGYVPGLIHHYWHGKRSDRGYQTQWDLIKKYDYTDDKFLYRDDTGLWRLKEPEGAFAQELKAWFAARNEE